MKIGLEQIGWKAETLLAKPSPSQTEILQAELTLLEATVAKEEALTELSKLSETSDNLRSIVATIEKHGIDDSLVSLLIEELAKLTPAFESKQPEETLVVIRRTVEEVETQVVNAINKVVQAIAKSLAEYINSEETLAQKVSAEITTAKAIESPVIANPTAEVVLPKLTIAEYTTVVDTVFASIDPVATMLATDTYDGNADAVKALIVEIADLSVTETKKAEGCTATECISLVEGIVASITAIDPKNKDLMERMNKVAGLKAEPSEKPEGYISVEVAVKAMNAKVSAINDAAIKYLEGASAIISNIKKADAPAEPPAPAAPTEPPAPPAPAEQPAAPTE